MDSKDFFQECPHCKCTEFFSQDGNYFCEECNQQLNTQVEKEHDNFEMIKEYGARRFKTINKKDNILKSRRLTSFEEYNYILKELVEEILKIETIPNFKVTCLQLWISFLRKIEAAFFDKEQCVAPKLFALYRRADAEILYNKKPKRRKSKKKKQKIETIRYESDSQRVRHQRKLMRNSEKIISQELSESLRSETLNSSSLANLSIETIISDHENAELDIGFSKLGKKTMKRKMKQKLKEEEEQKTLFKDLNHKERLLVLNGHTLLCIIYSALNICKSNIQLTDLIRFIREGHLSYFKCKNLLPEDHIEEGVPLSFQEHHNYSMINYETLRAQVTNFTKIMPDLSTSIRLPDILKLCQRYAEEMRLPKDFLKQVQRLIIFFPPVMPYQKDSSLIPNYEGRAMAFIIFALKLLFGLDDYREEEMSNAARNVNEALKTNNKKERLFVYKDWMNFIEYRQVVLEKFYYPTLFHPDYSNDKPFLAFNAMLASIEPTTKNLESQIITTRQKHRMTNKMQTKQQLLKQKQSYPQLDEKSLISFQSSFLPLSDNFQRVILFDPALSVSEDFTEQLCDPYLRPKVFVESCKSLGVELQTKISTIPKSFFLTKPQLIVGYLHKEVFELGIMTEADWRKDLEKRIGIESKLNKKEELTFHKNWLKETIEKRRWWRSLIKTKKAKKSCNRSRDNETQPQTFEEKNILSDSEDDDDDSLSDSDEILFDQSIDPELQELLHEKSSEFEKLTLITPDFNVWQLSFQIIQSNLKGSDEEMEKLPQNFRWLLNFGASILHQEPKTLYYQVLSIEHQYMHILEPVELMENIITYQDKSLKNFQKIIRKFEQEW